MLGNAMNHFPPLLCIGETETEIQMLFYILEEGRYDFIHFLFSFFLIKAKCIIIIFFNCAENIVRMGHFRYPKS